MNCLPAGLITTVLNQYKNSPNFITDIGDQLNVDSINEKVQIRSHLLPLNFVEVSEASKVYQLSALSRYLNYSTITVDHHHAKLRVQNIKFSSPIIAPPWTWNVSPSTLRTAVISTRHVNPFSIIADQPGFISRYVRYWNFQIVVKASMLMSLLKRNW